MAPGFHLPGHGTSKKLPAASNSSIVVKGRSSAPNYPAPAVKYVTAQDALKDAKTHEHRQHLAQTCAVAAGAFALHEHKAARKHPQHEEKHKKKEKVAIAVVIGAGVIANHEKHEKKKALNQAKVLGHHARHHH